MLKNKKSAKNRFKGRIASRQIIAIVLAVILLAGGVTLGIKDWYHSSLLPLSTSTSTTYFTVESGTSVHNISINLEKSHLIRSAKAFETYVRSKDLNSKLQAGTYVLSPSMSVEQIVNKMVAGDVAKNLLTILPAKRLDQVKQAFKKSGYTDAQIASAFSPNQYRDIPVVATLPQGASLEGYLYPDSFQKLSDTPASLIVRESLEEMNKHVTPDITAGFAAHGLNTYQGITLASIVAQETDDPTYQPTVAQVFLRRLNIGMSLGSDVTAYYASAVAGQGKNLNVDSPYNTRLHTGLPPGPIGNVTDSALRAVANPSATDYLYFVAGDDKKMHFSHTDAEHQQAIEQYCQQGCRQ